MYVNGCKIECKLCTDNPEGFSSVVSRTNAKGEEVSRGPFAVIHDAQVYAHSWNDVDNPPPVPAEVVVTETKSESVAVQVEQPIKNPPVIETKSSPIGEENESDK